MRDLSASEALWITPHQADRHWVNTYKVRVKTEPIRYDVMTADLNRQPEETTMPDRGWKQAERNHARDVGSERIPVTGERHGADFVDGLFAYQLKVRKVIPAWIFEWLRGICTTAETTDRIGVLVMNQPRKPRREALVVVRWGDWVDLHGPEKGDHDA